MKNLRITLILSIFLTVNVFSQTDEPKSILVSKLYSYETLALVVRFDNGIDSIYFPIDTKLIKVQNKKLDANGKNVSPKKVYYEYRFTAKIDTTYKLPSAQLWSNNKSYEIPLDAYVILKKPQESIRLSKVDSIKLADKIEADRIEKYKVAEKERLESKIESRISKNINERGLLLWTDKNIVKINDHFKIVIESNMDFDKTSISIEDIENLSQKFKVKSAGISTIYDNGFKHHYRYFICQALASGEVTMKPLEIKTEDKKIKTNHWNFKITN
ncbi:hypothetical protein KORDIASMS9_04301 [Kordia sp. SMS9]|uniref:BatD family protein n=1 Tax=Kordia sp. SMS9 TaxID=2282170 RepID=UPI000E0D8DD1|nr:BatD family protein [Kordia sp. SMS9]AXG72039.1 hypothetical protein KORDIASMS9_04301 [Kordia sp. SMS9]